MSAPYLLPSRDRGPVHTYEIAALLPKTRSGKIMRRILRKIAAGKQDEDGSGHDPSLQCRVSLGRQAGDVNPAGQGVKRGGLGGPENGKCPYFFLRHC